MQDGRFYYIVEDNNSEKDESSGAVKQGAAHAHEIHKQEVQTGESVLRIVSGLNRSTERQL